MGEQTAVPATDVMDALRAVHFLRDAAELTRERLAAISRIMDFPPAAMIVRQGEPARSIYLIASGQVAVEICAAGVGCKRILTVGDGELLGWSALLEPMGWTASARTLTPTRVIELDGARLRQLCDDDPRFGYEVMRRVALSLVARLNATRLQLMDVYGASLPELFASSGVESASGAKGGDQPARDPS